MRLSKQTVWREQHTVRLVRFVRVDKESPRRCGKQGKITPFTNASNFFRITSRNFIFFLRLFDRKCQER